MFNKFTLEEREKEGKRGKESLINLQIYKFTNVYYFESISLAISLQ